MGTLLELFLGMPGRAVRDRARAAQPTELSSPCELLESALCHPEKQINCCRNPEKGAVVEKVVAFDLSRGWRRSLQERARQVAGGARWRQQPERGCRGAVWMGKGPAKSKGLILVPGYRVLRPAVSPVPPWSPALGMCSTETLKPGGKAASDSRFQSPGPREHRARPGGN